MSNRAATSQAVNSHAASSLRRKLLMAASLLLALLAAWRIVAVTTADRATANAPSRALHWQSYHPDAMLALAREQLDAGNDTNAVATLRILLAHAPLQGSAIALLAWTAARDGDQARAQALYRIAARRAPRDPQVHAWLGDRALKSGHYAAALDQIDIIFRVTPSLRQALVPAVVRNAANPAFAQALVAALKRRPIWRGNVLRALREGKDQALASRIFGALQQQGGLDADEIDGWLTQLMRRGNWGEAYARWAGALDLNGGAIPAVYNGGFDTMPSEQDAGFGWRLFRAPGVLVEFVPVQGARGLVAHAVFLGRPVEQVSLEHPLLLARGNYQLTVRMRAEALRSSSGLEWTVTCRGQPQPVASGDRISGSFPWRVLTMRFRIPRQGCDGQWLRLRNPAPRGSARVVSGAVWFDDVVIASTNRK